MPGPPPKDPSLRQRRNRSATRGTFVDDGTARPKRAPELPGGRSASWHPLTRSWWRDVWASPMRSEYLRMDVQGLYRLAYLINRFWQAGDVTLEGPIRLLGQRYGLDPMSRRSLQWEVLKVEEAEERSRRRRPPREPVADPRALLSVVDGKPPARRRRRQATT